MRHRERERQSEAQRERERERERERKHCELICSMREIARASGKYPETSRKRHQRVR